MFDDMQRSTLDYLCDYFVTNNLNQFIWCRQLVIPTFKLEMDYYIPETTNQYNA